MLLPPWLAAHNAEMLEFVKHQFELKFARRSLVVLLALSAGLISCQKPGDAKSVQATSRPFDPSRWMEDHLFDLGDRSLHQLVLPASHDSAMYLTGFPQSLGRTQRLTIYGQLSQGVRYFDLRPQWRDGILYLHHDIITGPTFRQVLDDVRRFLNEGHRELIILKLSHYDAFNTDRYSTTVAMIQDRLSTWLYADKPQNKRLADIELSEYLHAGGRVIVVCDGNYPLRSPHAGIWVYRDWDSADAASGDLRVFDQYSNTTSYARMKLDQLAKLDRFDGFCRDRNDLPCDLFLLSWTLTPPTDVLAFAAQPNQDLSSALHQAKIPNIHQQIPNLLYEDCIDSPSLAQTALSLSLIKIHQSK